MSEQRVDFEDLIGAWRTAFEAAQAALQAASHELSPSDLRFWNQRLGEERAVTVRLLEALGLERHTRRRLVRLVSSPWETKRLLGLPADSLACVFSVDGVLLPSVATHVEAWREMLDTFIARRIERTGVALASFSVQVDYPTYIHGRTRAEAVRAFLESRGIVLPDGSPDDPTTAESVNGLANRKNQALLRLLERGDVRAFEGARLYLELAHDAKVLCAVVSGSTNTRLLLDSSRFSALVDDCVDGNAMRAEGLRRKPAPDAVLAACRHLSVEPTRVVVFETTPEGVTAGRAAGAELVVGVEREGDAAALRAVGADVVVSDLGEMLERQLGA